MPDGFSHCEGYLDSIANLTNDERNVTDDCHCTINIELPQSLRPPWNIYYGMKNYYQNHRRYISSLDIDQLRSNRPLNQNPSSDCRPLVTNHESLPIVPCGLIANSWFNGMLDQECTLGCVDEHALLLPIFSWIVFAYLAQAEWNKSRPWLISIPWAWAIILVGVVQHSMVQSLK